jgi:hypothetical protein
MGTTLKRGGVLPTEFAGSMAEAMEVALNQLLSATGKPTVPTDDSDEVRDRRILFVAIARGVIDHLVDNEDAFTIRRQDDDTVELAQHNVRIEKS